MSIKTLRVIDSHTGGEPTRIIVEGAPNLPDIPMNEKLEILKQEHDHLRRAVANEPRGSDICVGALLTAPHDRNNTAGVIFFNNVGYLGMCGHGTIGLIQTLFYLNKIEPGIHKIETPVGLVKCNLHENGKVTINNVPSFRSQKKVKLEVPNYGPSVGDVAWGGNWFFLISEHGLELKIDNVNKLTDYCINVKQALKINNITGNDGKEIDHIELFDKPLNSKNHSRNFVLCPGNSYDRSPCGTGTSAKMACLFEDGLLKENQSWFQESIIGSVFEGSIKKINDFIIPSISGYAFVNADSNFILNPQDPFCWGITNE